MILYKRLMIILMLFVLSLTQEFVVAADLSAEFSGEIYMSACRMVDSVGVNVHLGTISAKALPEIGSRAGMKKFSFQLIGCPAKKKIYLRFSGRSYKNYNNTLFLRVNNEGQPGVVSGVQIGLLKMDGQLLEFAATDTEDVVADERGNANFELIAFYQRTGTVISGIADATATFTVLYDHLDH